MLKIGISSYSMSQAIHAKEMTIVNVVEWAAEQGCEHIEIVPIGFTLDDNPSLVEQIKHTATECGIGLSNYLVKADFIQTSERERKAEITRVKDQVDIAAALGVKLMRHDVSYRSGAAANLTNYYTDLPILVESCREIADYAAGYGITTSVENHGMYIQHSERVRKLIQEVDRTNFKTTLDVGNFLCVDEDPLAAIKANLPFASIIHLKDFYYRPAYMNPGAGFFQTINGNYLRGAIFGQGDLNVREILRLIADSPFSGYLSLEFEGKEECRFAVKTGLENISNLLRTITC